MKIKWGSVLKKSNCETKLDVCSNYHSTIEFIGRKWMGIIIYALMSGPKRYHEILSAVPGISDRLFTKRLNELVIANIVNKHYLDSSTKKVEYTLTPSGIALKEVIVAIHHWIEVYEWEQNK